MKQPEDNKTLELLPKRGRPSTGQAMTPAQRKREQRARDRQASRTDDYANCTTERLLFDLGYAVTHGLTHNFVAISAELQRRAEQVHAASLTHARQHREAVTVTETKPVTKTVTVTKTKPTPKTVTVTETKPASKKVTVTKTRPAPKYRNKQTGETWTGRGLQPAWVMAWIAKGGKVDDLLL